MRITIDTAHDSKEHIKKAIDLLRSMVDSSDMNSGGYNDLFGNSSSQSSEQPSSSSGGMFDMFSSPAQEPQAPQPMQEKPPKPKGPTMMGFELYE